MSSTYVIAELAGTHDGSEDRLMRLLDVAYAADADAVKLQYWSDSAKVAARLNAPELEPLYERVRTPLEWVKFASSIAHSRDQEFLCTVDLVEDIPTVAPYVDRWKIASVEAHDEAFIRAHLACATKPLVISTGMLTEDDADLIAWYQGEFDVPTWLLHCVSGYPTPIDEANLAAIRAWGLDGFSDHSAHVLTGAFAVCAGARVIEVHVKADDTPDDNPDAPHSLTPDGFRQYVQNVRLAERMLGDGVKRIMPSEQPTLRHRVTV